MDWLADPLVSHTLLGQATLVGKASPVGATPLVGKAPKRLGSVACLAMVVFAMTGCQLLTEGTDQQDGGMEITEAEVQKMLTSSNPIACSATTDAGYSDTARIYTKIAISQAPTLIRAKVVSDAELQRALDGLRPQLEVLALKTTWLPMAAEGMIGDWLSRQAALQEWKPPQHQRRLIDDTITPMFNELKRYAADEAKSPLPFKMRLVRDDTLRAPQTLPGGIVLIPSGMISGLSRVKDPEPIIAFMLAHEFSHSLRRHKTKLYQQSLVFPMTKVKQFRQLVKENPGGIGKLTSMDQLVSFSSSNVESLMNEVCTAQNWKPNMEQPQELEADVCGALLLHRLGTVTNRRYSATESYRAYVKDLGPDETPPEKDVDGCTIKTSHPPVKDREATLDRYESYLVKGAAR